MTFLPTIVDALRPIVFVVVPGLIAGLAVIALDALCALGIPWISRYRIRLRCDMISFRRQKP